NIYLDNIYFYKEPTTATEPSAAAPLPTEDAADVVSIYSDSYTNLAETNFNPNWGQSTAVSFVDVAGNETMKYANFNYQGTNLGSNDGTAQDLSAMEFLHVDIWTADATVVKLTPISASTGEFLYELTPLTQGTWNSYDIPVGDFTDVSMADIHQLKFDGQAGVNPSNIYLDNIYFYKEPTTATEPSAAAPLPTEDAADVVSIYSDSYTNLAGTDFNPGWGQTTVVSNEDIGGNEMMKYASFNYQGTQLDGNQDLSAMEFLHVDIWTADATVVKLTPISASTGEFLYELTPLTQGTWNSYDIPVGDFTDVSMADIHQLKFDGQAGVNPSNIYLDNIYFWKTPTASGSDATLSDLQVDETTVTGFSANMMSYNMELPYGTTIIPTVTATTTDPNAEFVINAAGALPGITEVVVTADDDITSLTYNVNFTLANAVPTVGAPVPTHDETDDNVFSIYSDSYTNLEATNFNPAWGQSTQVVV
ncbi:hypothetical protein HNS40_22385, partial [Lentimicrobium sp. S6]|nr:hypothetical protein [Lentimicrobium sp. S6]